MFHRLFVQLWPRVSTSAIVLVCSWVLLRPLTTSAQDPAPHDAIVANSQTMVTKGRQILTTET
jgi:hypothetical protein